MSVSDVRFSVIIPVYNGAGTIARAIESILDQSLQAHEIIVVDDGSSDDIDGVLARFEGKLRYVRRNRSGPGAARNHGAGLSTGDWLAFLDSDDWYYPDRLQVYAKYIADNPDLDCIFGACDILTPEGDKVGVNLDRSEAGRRLRRRAADTDMTSFISDDLLAFGCEDFGHANTFSIKRQKFLEIGGFSEELTLGEDRFLWMRAVARCADVGAVLVPTACYVHYQESTFRRGTMEARINAFRASRLILKSAAGYPAALRRGIRRRLLRDRRQLAHGYHRLGRRLRSIAAVIPSLWENPGWMALRDVLSMLRG